MSAYAASALVVFTIFAARSYITGLDYSHALRAYGQTGVLGFDDQLLRRYNGRVLRFFWDAIVTSSLSVFRHPHVEPELRRRRFDYLLSVVGLVVSFVLIWPLWFIR